MCPIKNLLAKRSTRDLHNQELLSPFPNYVSEEHDSKRGSKSKRESVRPQPCFYISQGVYTANELFAGRPKVYLISQLLWREKEQTWWYLLRDGVNPDGPLTGWVAEPAMKAVESEGMVLC